MPEKNTLPPLPLKDWKSTRETLKWYSRALGVVPRALAPAHPKWWHISLKVAPGGLVTDDMTLPNGDTFFLKMDLRKHVVAVSSGSEALREFSMQAGLSATAFGDQLLSALDELGLKGDYAREKYKNEDVRKYNPQIAQNFLEAITLADQVFEQQRSSLTGEVGPVQLWSHGFDLAIEWFGTRMVESEENGELIQYPSQLNLGFSPGEPSHPEPYFYSNPWPFEQDVLLDKPLPPGARWFTQGWQGSILPYAELVGDPNPAERLLAYAQAVYAAAAPTLLE